MQNPQQLDCLSLNPVGHEVGCAANDELPRSFDAARAAHSWKLLQVSHHLENTLRDSLGRHRALLRDESAYLLEVPDRRLRPLQSHDGGGSSFSVPQLSSQIDTLS